jgi:hypothetical protein
LAAGVDHIGDLGDVGGGDRHVVREVGAYAVLGVEALEHLDEAAAERVELGFAAGPHRAVPPVHRPVDVDREGQDVEPAGAVGSDGETSQVVVVEVAVGEAHREACVAAYRLECLGVGLGG